MVKYFHAEVDDAFKEYTKIHPFSFEHTKKYMEDKNMDITLTVPLEKKYLDIATTVYKKIVSELKCP